jgi:hypothetical protein
MITVASIETGPKKSKIMTTEGRRLGCFNDKLAKWGIEQGASYNVETVDNDFGTNIVSAKRVTMGLPTSQTPTSTTPSSGGGASGVFRTPKQLFVSEVLTAYIAAGRCEPQKLTETINYIAAAWDCTLGGNPPHQHLEAAE